MKVKQPIKKPKKDSQPKPPLETQEAGNEILIELKNSMKMSLGTWKLPTTITPK